MTYMCSFCRNSLTPGFVRDSQQPEVVKGPVCFVWVRGIDRLMLEDSLATEVGCSKQRAVSDKTGDLQFENGGADTSRITAHA
jgi:hypothetical protein